MSRNFLALLLLLFVTKNSANGQLEEWCIVDEQTPDSELQVALDWACGKGGADCSKIQKDQVCYYPNTVRDHASYAFNNYFQKYKKKGGTCFFNNAAMVTQVDPSHNSCHYEYMP
ncbi:unnamed protein product [Withania somnifera]